MEQNPSNVRSGWKAIESIIAAATWRCYSACLRLYHYYDKSLKN